MIRRPPRATLFPSPTLFRSGKRFAGVRTQDHAYARCMGELAYYRRLVSKGVLRQIRDRPGLDAHLEEWERSADSCPLGFVLGMEGADGIVDETQVGDWWEEGLRVVSLCHYGISSYSHGTQAPCGLTPRGAPLLRDDSYLAARMVDTREVGNRLVRSLATSPPTAFSPLPQARTTLPPAPPPVCCDGLGVPGAGGDGAR